MEKDLARTLICLSLVLTTPPGAVAAPRPVEPSSQGTIHVPSFDLPVSSLFTDGERSAYDAYHEHIQSIFPGESALAKCGPALASELYARSVRACRTALIRASRFFQEFRHRYPVSVSSAKLGGVAVEIFEPIDGVSMRNRRRILINLHGGHFKTGWGWISYLESAPISSFGKFTIVSVDYRHAPEAKFPAASEDVASVYKALLATHRPEQIGIFGCSAGGLLTAEAIAWFEHAGLPMPGAIGIFGSGASYYQEGDSAQQAFAIGRRKAESVADHPYFGPTAAKDPLAFPILAPEILRKFPPSLIISSTRDLSLSAAVNTHARLVALQRKSELHVWEAMPHCFFNGGPFPQTEEANQVIASFLDKELAP